MKRTLFVLVAFLYCNIAWQAVVWGRSSFSAFVALLLILIVPIAVGVVLFLIFNKYVSEDWSAVFIGAGLIIPIVFMFTYATRMPEYVEFVQNGRLVFDGRASELTNHDATFYTIRDYVTKDLKDGQFGVSYTTTSRKSTTTHTKHFALPVFSSTSEERPLLWFVSSYSSGSSRVDDGNYGVYGFDKTALPPITWSGKLARGLKNSDDSARNAVWQYLKKKKLPDEAAPLMLVPVDESAEEYYRTGAIQFWSFTAVLNLVFLGVCIYASRGAENG